MVEVYSEPNITADTPSLWVQVGVIFGGAALIVGVAVLAAYIARKIWNRDGEIGSVECIAGTLVLIGCLMGLLVYEVNFLDEERDWRAQELEAAEQREQVQENNQRSTEEQFIDRYGDVVMLWCTDSTCDHHHDDLYDIITGGSATEDVTFQDEDGVVYEDAYLLREDSGADDVDYTVTLMVRHGHDDVEEYTTPGSP